MNPLTRLNPFENFSFADHLWPPAQAVKTITKISALAFLALAILKQDLRQLIPVLGSVILHQFAARFSHPILRPIGGNDLMAFMRGLQKLNPEYGSVIDVDGRALSPNEQAVLMSHANVREFYLRFTEYKAPERFMNPRFFDLVCEYLTMRLEDGSKFLLQRTEEYYNTPPNPPKSQREPIVMLHKYFERQFSHLMEIPENEVNKTQAFYFEAWNKGHKLSICLTNPNRQDIYVKLQRLSNLLNFPVELRSVPAGCIDKGTFDAIFNPGN